VLLVHGAEGGTIHLPFVVGYTTPPGASIACPIDPKTVPDGMRYVGTDEGKMVYGDSRFREAPEVVAVAPFLIDVREVTNAEYARYLDGLDPKLRARAVPRARIPGGDTRPVWNADGDRFTFPDGTADHPVAGISFLDALGSARSVEKRPPTPQEWELAARGIDGRDYPWGMRLDPTYANIATGSVEAVGTFLRDRSPFGVLDMGGNVAEWTDDAGAESTIVKGGSFELARIHAMPTFLARRLASSPWIDVGFRCARSLPK
jgi:formylglycine-generating enzyme required for sulfatase activity